MAKAWNPTEEDRRKVAMYAGLGLTHTQIGLLMGKCERTIRNHVKDDVDRGKAEMIAKIAGNLAQKALNGDKIAQIFYLKCQAGWREVDRVEHTGADGAALFPQAVEWNIAEPKQIEGRVIEADSGD